MTRMIELLENNQKYLVNRVLGYAKRHHYTQYASALEETWAESVKGLSDAMIFALRQDAQIPEIELKQPPADEKMFAFIIREARRNLRRGVTLEMYLGLMKYYRQAYLDLMMEQTVDLEKRGMYLSWVNRFFNQAELLSCREWHDMSKDELSQELQKANRDLTSLKNKYLTIFESITTPTLIIDADGRLIDLNQAARQLFLAVFRVMRCAEDRGRQSCLGKITDILPWLAEEYEEYIRKERPDLRTEKVYLSADGTENCLEIQFHRMQDVGSQCSGTVVMLFDITERKRAEEQLRYVSFHDPMTDLYNRTYFEQEVIRAASGRFNPVGIISCDIDGLKLANDSLGHNAGDALIMAVGGILKSCFRKSDVVARTGGDEFMVLMLLSNEEAVQRACGRVRENIERHNRENPATPVGLSMGCAAGSVMDSRDLHSLIKAADTKMYTQKQSNRQKYAALFAEGLEQFGEELFRRPVSANEKVQMGSRTGANR